MDKATQCEPETRSEDYPSRSVPGQIRAWKRANRKMGRDITEDEFRSIRSPSVFPSEDHGHKSLLNVISNDTPHIVHLQTKPFNFVGNTLPSSDPVPIFPVDQLDHTLHGKAFIQFSADEVLLFKCPVRSVA